MKFSYHIWVNIFGILSTVVTQGNGKFNSASTNHYLQLKQVNKLNIISSPNYVNYEMDLKQEDIIDEFVALKPRMFSLGHEHSPQLFVI